MSSLFRMRPRYVLDVAGRPDDVRARLSHALARDDAPCRGSVGPHKLQVRTRGEHHFWSPELHGTVQPRGDAARVVGRFGPRPAVWTMFTVIYIHLAFIGIAGAVYAMAQATLDRAPTALWAAPIALAAAVVVRVVAHIGQSLGGDEMQRIRDFVAASTEAGEQLRDAPAETPHIGA